jgi:hypothetical protein
MGEDDHEDTEHWDEYQWERFLQQQDRATEKYFRLLEQYADHPDRDRIIAKEMGWEVMDEEEDGEWDEAADAFCELEQMAESEDVEDDFESFVRSPIHGETLRLHSWVHAWLDRHPELKEHPEAIRLASQGALCAAKIAAALCGDDGVEIGMTIAYLKRGLKAANETLDAVARLVEDASMSPRERSAFNRRLFPVRDRVVDLMRHYRAEWKKRCEGG